LGSNFATSGGYGPNQVSTALGLGVFVLLYHFLTRQRLFQIKFVDEALLLFFVFRGLLTFSRGGVMVPVLAMLVFYYILQKHKNFRIKEKVMRKIKVTQILVAGILIGWHFPVCQPIDKRAIALAVSR
jgi:hypothetical protein